MSVPGSVFFLMVLAAFAMHLRTQIPLMRAISNLNKQVKSEGSTWCYWDDWQLRVRLLRDPAAIFAETDTPTVRALKQEVLERRTEIIKGWPILLGIMLGGFILAIVAAVIDFAIRGIK